MSSLIVEELESRCLLSLAHIVVVNEQVEASPAEVAATAAAIQMQVMRDFAPIWHRPAVIRITSNPTDIKSGEEPVFLQDAGTDFYSLPGLGWHDTFHPPGARKELRIPDAFVEVDFNISDHEDWRLTLSHEVLEMLADPTTNRVAFVPQFDPISDVIRSGPAQISIEVADPVERSFYDGFLSDFVTPNWFATNPAARARVDFLHHLHHPQQLELGGSVIFFQRGFWRQVISF